MSDQFDIRKNDRGVTMRFQSGRQSISRFLDKIEVVQMAYTSPCWKWTASTDAAGYSRFGANGERYAHRFSYAFFIGDIPDGCHVDHLCNYRTCVNPLHLEAVLPAVNWKRRDEKRTHCVNGHEFTPENTHPSTNGRICKTCRYDRIKAWRERHPEHSRTVETASKQRWRLAQAKAGRTGRY